MVDTYVAGGNPMTTVKELYAILGEVIAEGKGDLPIVMSSDAEGNGYNYYEGSYGESRYDRQYGGSIYEQDDIDDLEMDEEEVAALEDVFVIWPC
jgi:hypothetical protein